MTVDHDLPKVRRCWHLWRGRWKVQPVGWGGRVFRLCAVCDHERAINQVRSCPHWWRIRHYFYRVAPDPANGGRFRHVGEPRRHCMRCCEDEQKRDMEEALNAERQGNDDRRRARPQRVDGEDPR